MNIALGTILLFLLIIPGIAFRLAYFYGPLTKKLSKHSAFDDFIWGIIPGVAFQLIGSLLVNSWKPFGYQIDFSSLGKILFASSEAAKEFGKIEERLSQIIFYNFSLITSAFTIGFLLRRGIRFFHLDHFFKSLRFNNEWFYYMRGEFIFFIENRDEDEVAERIEQVREARKSSKERKLLFFWSWKTPLWTWRLRAFFRRNKDLGCTIYAVVNIDKDSTFIYEGILDSFHLCKDGSLDTIVLSQPKRKKFFDLIETEYYDIETGIIILKDEHIINISVAPLYTFTPRNINDAIKNVPSEQNQENIFNEINQRLAGAKEEIYKAESKVSNATTDLALKSEKENEAITSLQKAKETDEALKAISGIAQKTEAVRVAREEKERAEKELEEAKKKAELAKKKKLLIEAELKLAEATEKKAEANKIIV